MHWTNVSLSLSGCLSPLTLAHSSHSLLGIRPQPQRCDGRWQLAQKGWHVTGKCAAPKMSFLIKRFWSVVNCRMLKKWETVCDPTYKDVILQDRKKLLHGILKALYVLIMLRFSKTYLKLILSLRTFRSNNGKFTRSLRDENPHPCHPTCSENASRPLTVPIHITSYDYFVAPWFIAPHVYLTGT